MPATGNPGPRARPFPFPKRLINPAEAGHRSNSVCVIHHIAMKLGRKLKWDPQVERFIGDDEANKMLDFPHRKPWVV